MHASSEGLCPPRPSAAGFALPVSRDPVRRPWGPLAGSAPLSPSVPFPRSLRDLFHPHSLPQVPFLSVPPRSEEPELAWSRSRRECVCCSSLAPASLLHFSAVRVEHDGAVNSFKNSLFQNLQHAVATLRGLSIIETSLVSF